MLADTLCGMISRIFLIGVLGLPEVRRWICTSESCKARTYIGTNTVKRVGCWDPLKIHCSKKTSISLGVKGQEKECSWWSLDMKWGSGKRSLLGEILTVTESGRSKDSVQAMRRGRQEQIPWPHSWLFISPRVGICLIFILILFVVHPPPSKPICILD